MNGITHSCQVLCRAMSHAANHRRTGMDANPHPQRRLQLCCQTLTQIAQTVYHVASRSECLQAAHFWTGCNTK
jgi:hypothetical protein